MPVVGSPSFLIMNFQNFLPPSAINTHPTLSSKHNTAQIPSQPVSSGNKSNTKTGLGKIKIIGGGGKEKQNL